MHHHSTCIVQVLHATIEPCQLWQPCGILEQISSMPGTRFKNPQRVWPLCTRQLLQGSSGTNKPRRPPSSAWRSLSLLVSTSRFSGCCCDRHPFQAAHGRPIFNRSLVQGPFRFHVPHPPPGNVKNLPEHGSWSSHRQSVRPDVPSYPSLLIWVSRPVRQPPLSPNIIHNQVEIS